MSPICKTHPPRASELPAGVPVLLFVCILEQSGRNTENSRLHITKTLSVFDQGPLTWFVDTHRENQRQRGAVPHAARRMQRKAAPGPKAAPKSTRSPASRRSPASHVGALRVISATLVNPHNVRSRAVLKADWRCWLGAHIGDNAVAQSGQAAAGRLVELNHVIRAGMGQGRPPDRIDRHPPRPGRRPGTTAIDHGGVRGSSVNQPGDSGAGPVPFAR